MAGAAIRLVQSGHKGMDVVSNITQVGCVYTMLNPKCVARKSAPQFYITTIDKAGRINAFMSAEPSSDPTI